VVLAALPPPQAPAKPVVGNAHQLTGIASYYWQDQMTASGERFDKRAMTAAHKTFPLGTKVRVTHVASGRTVVVRINDRGPFKPGRVIDLSEAAAEQLQMTLAGLAQVTLEVVR
jgi:rare lipoprotein A